MRSALLVRDEIASVLGKSGYTGHVDASEAFPFHCGSEDASYSVMYQGNMTSIFTHASFDRFKFTPSFFSAEKGLSVQVLSHRIPGNPTEAFTALSKRVEYRYQYSPLQSFFNAFKVNFRKKEFFKFKEQTDASHRAIKGFSGPLERSGYFTVDRGMNCFFKMFAPILFDRGIPQFIDEVNYNLSYILLPNNRYCTVIEIPSLSNIMRTGLTLPPADIESIICSIVNYPTASEMNTYRNEVREYSDFVTEFKKTRDDSSFMTQAIDNEMLLDAEKGFVLMRNYIFLVSNDPLDLRNKADKYFQVLHASGMAFNTTMLRTKDAFCSSFPGHARFLPSGSRVQFTLIPRLVELFHKC
jgi:hypothetical protein